MKTSALVMVMTVLFAGCGKELPLRPHEHPVREDVIATPGKFGDGPAIVLGGDTTAIPARIGKLEKLPIPSQELKAGQEAIIFRFKATSEESDAQVPLYKGIVTRSGVEGTAWIGVYTDSSFTVLAPSSETVITKDGAVYVLLKGKTAYVQVTFKVSRITPNGSITATFEGLGTETLKASG